MRRDHAPLLIAAVALAVLPFVLDRIGLPLRTSIDVVLFAIACLGLNVLVGYTGLVSFGHGAWFGLGAYAAALSQKYWFTGSIVLPAFFAVLFIAVTAALAGALILRRRGVYFSLLTLALTALLFAIGYRWTEFTGGESGLGGVTRATVLGLNLERDAIYYWVVAAVGFVVAFLLWRFHRSPAGSVLVAIRENEQRARFLGYPTNRYKLLGFVISATVVGIAGVLSVFNHRFAAAEPLAVAFSGELIAMVVIGGMRSFLGPALGALFYILFREFLSIWTPNWLFYFGILFVGFIMFSPTGLVGVAQRLLTPFRKPIEEEAAMAGRTLSDEPLPAFLKPADHAAEPILEARAIAKSFGGIKAVQGVDILVRDRSLHALIGPNGAGKTTAFNLISGMFVPDEGDDPAPRPLDRRLKPGGDHRGRDRPLLPDHQPVPGALGRGERAARDPGAPSAPLRSLGAGARARRRRARDRGAHPLSRRRRHGAGRGRRALLWRPAPPRHGPRPGDEAAAAAPRRAARRARRRGAPAHRRHRQAHLVGRARAPRRARHRPGVPDRRCRHGHERRPCARRRHRRGRPVEPARPGGLYRHRRRDAGGKAARERRRAGNAACRLGGEYLLRQEPRPGRRRLRRASSTRSWRCSAATAPASRRCSRR